MCKKVFFFSLIMTIFFGVAGAWAEFYVIAAKRPPEGTVPSWGITREGETRSVDWQDYVPNPRFAIYDAGTPENLGDDLVVDKETGLIWSRNANPLGSEKSFANARDGSLNLGYGARMGWRLPSAGELSTLINPRRSSPALPEYHPFLDVQSGDYWTATQGARIQGAGEYLIERTLVNMGDGLVERCAGSGCLGISGHAWAVRGPDYFSATPITIP